VVDEAGILDLAAKAALEQKRQQSLPTSRRRPLAHLSWLRSLQGTSIEDYGYQLGRHWQIGQKGKSGGHTYCGAERA
jgi:uncharacterized protein